MNQPSGTGGRLRRLPPVDASNRIAGDEAAELPETVALADPSAPVHALRHRRRHAFGGDQQRRQACAERFGPSASAAACMAPLGKSPDQPVDHLGQHHAVGTGGEVQRHAMAQHRTGKRRPRRRCSVPAARQAAPARARPASAPAPHAARDPRRRAGAPCRRRPISGRPPRTSDRIASTTFSPTGTRRISAWAAQQFIGGHGRLRRRGFGCPVVASSMVRSASSSG